LWNIISADWPRTARLRVLALSGRGEASIDRVYRRLRDWRPTTPT